MNRKLLACFITAACMVAFLLPKIQAAQTRLTDYAGSESNYTSSDTLRVGVVAKTDTVYAYRADKISITIQAVTITDTLIVNIEQSQDGIHFSDSLTDTLLTAATYSYTVSDVDVYPWVVVNFSQAGADTVTVAPLRYRVGRKLAY